MSRAGCPNAGSDAAQFGGVAIGSDAPGCRVGDSNQAGVFDSEKLDALRQIGEALPGNAAVCRGDDDGAIGIYVATAASIDSRVASVPKSKI
jgi:hypothetical protein